MPEGAGGAYGLPRVPRFVVPRARLFALLDGAKGITVVSGALGMGKSVLVADWLRQRTTPTPVLWITADAVRGRDEVWRTVAEWATDAGFIPVGEGEPVAQAVDSAQAFDAALHAVHEALPHDVLLVLDGVDDIGDHRLVDDAVLLTRDHPDRRVVVTTRSSLDVAATLPGVVIGPRDLLFTVDEVAAAVALDAAEARATHEATGGVPLLVRLARLVKDDGGALSRSSLLETLPPRFVPLIAGSLEDLGCVLSYPEPLMGALVAEIGVRFPGEMARLLPGAVDAAERGGDWVAALRLAVAAGDLSRADGIARAAWPRAADGDAALVIGALGAVSKRRLRRYPVLLLLLALGYTAMPNQRARAAECLGLVVAARSRSGGTAEERVLTVTAESVAYRLLGEAVSAARSGRAAVDALNGVQLDDDVRALVLMQAGCSVFCTGDALRARELFEQAAAHSADSRAHALAGAMLGGLDALEGARDGASRMPAVTGHPEQPRGWSGDSSTFRQVAAAVRALERFDVEAAQRACDALADHDGPSERWAWSLRVQSTIDLVRDGPVAASTLLAGRIATGPDSTLNPMARDVLGRGRALLALADGRPGEAELVLRGVTSCPALTAVARARIELVTGRADAALRGLAAIDHGRGIRSLAEALLLEAAAHHELGSEGLAADAFARAVDVLLDSGLRMPLALTPRAPLLALARAADAVGASRVAELGIDRVPSLLPERAVRIALSERERVVLSALVETGNAQEIAAALSVSPNTVKTQLRSIYRKLGVGSRDEALSRAGQLGLFSTDPPLR